MLLVRALIGAWKLGRAYFGDKLTLVPMQTAGGDI